MAICEKCGSDNAKFKREKSGTISGARMQHTSSGTSAKAGGSSLSVRGSSRSTDGARAATEMTAYRVVGFCPDCGYSWVVQDDMQEAVEAMEAARDPKKRKEWEKKRKTQEKAAKEQAREQITTSAVPKGKGKIANVPALVLCILFGYFGAHKFYEKKIGMGILYFFTLGLFGIGWIVDIVKLATDRVPPLD